MRFLANIKNRFRAFVNSDFYADFCWHFEYYFIRKPRRWYNFVMNRTIRYIKLGFNPEDIWSLDYSFAKYMLPRIKRLKIISDSYPSGLTRKQWERELNKMIAAFDLMTDEDKYYKMDCNSSRYHNSKAEKIIDEGLDSFRKYVRALWW